MEIPYTTTPRADTGLTNGKIAIWLFLASEVMLFGAFFAAYIMLRLGNADWLAQKETAQLAVPLAALNTAILATSSITIVMAWTSLLREQLARYRLYMLATVALGVAFLAIKLYEYQTKLAHGLEPATNIFLALYFVMTGLHGLHLVGGIVLNAYLALPGAKLWRRSPQWLINRVENAGLYWHFVDLVWLFLFPLFYLF
jgi:heme/copper-type cytochrome/quinol oxidase subunit 3